MWIDVDGRCRLVAGNQAALQANLSAMASPKVLFIDGLPGSGKSTAARDVGHDLPGSRVYLESAPEHPLLVGSPDLMGAAFAKIHEIHSVQSFATAALDRLDAFLTTAEDGAPYVFESHPIQSTVRVLLQLDASESAIKEFWFNLQDRLSSVEPRLVYLQESDPRQALSGIIGKRGPAWETYLVEAFNHYPWMKSRGLSGIEGVGELFVQYSAAIDRLVATWRFPSLALAARPASYQERRKTLVRWLAANP